MLLTGMAFGLNRACQYCGEKLFNKGKGKVTVMKHYKAVFFDRDGTLTYFNQEKEAWRDKMITSWSGKPFDLPYDKMMHLFTLAAGGRRPWYRNVDDERAFFRRYYRCLLVGEGITEQLEKRTELLFRELWCNHDRCLYAETAEVLAYFKKNGYKIGVISDTSPSLELTLVSLGLGEYIDSYTASSLVGAGKPDPRIYQAALDSLDVRAEESLYVDDYDVEAEGARKMGFTAFHIVRDGETDFEKYQVKSLNDLIKYIES